VRLKPASKGELLRLFALGVPAYRQRFESNASPKTIERFHRLLRACCAASEQLREPFKGEVECDETAFGGWRKGRRGRGAAGKVLVFGLVQRNGHVKAMPIETASEANIMREIQAHTREGSLFYTDGWHAYATLPLRGEHVVIRKEKGRPVGRDHINGIEGFWSYAKNWLYPFRGVPRRFFHLYLAEVCFRFNHRDRDLKPMLMRLMKRTSIQELSSTLVRKR
jgi:transposase